MKKKDQEHKRALSEEKSEVTRLLRELDRVGKVKDKLKKDRDMLQSEKDSIQKERDTLKDGLKLTEWLKPKLKQRKMIWLLTRRSAQNGWLTLLALMKTWIVSLPNLLFPFCSYPTHNFVYPRLTQR